MPLWTLIGLLQGKATTSWPTVEAENGQSGVLGMPRYQPEHCKPDCNKCVDACLPHAISRPDPDKPVQVDYGRCINCQLCTEVCPSNAFTPSLDWAFGVRERHDLIWQEKTGTEKPPLSSKQLLNEYNVPPLNTKEILTHEESLSAFTRSLHIRHVDAGSCNGCESELTALTNPFYNLDRFGIFFTASPRFADLLLVTGPVTYAMHKSLLATYEAMPEPRWVMAVGTCAVSGGSAGGGYACYHGLEGILPVDVYLPGCPPNPAALITALLMFLKRLPQKVHGGQIDDPSI